MKGKCYYCGKEYEGSGMTRHLKTCKIKEKYLDIKSKNSDNEKIYFMIQMKPEYGFHWMYILIDTSYTLSKLDQFIRDIWVECCNHLSRFKIGDDYFENEDMMIYSLEKVFSIGTQFSYEYDFGSTTRLNLKVMDMLYSGEIDGGIQIIARNNPENLYNIEDFSNSPRDGVCGYYGDINKEKEFMPEQELLKKASDKKYKIDKNDCIDPKYKSWYKLYKAAEEFNNYEPWLWITDVQIFGVKDPKSGQLGFCCVLGNSKECFGLAVYRGWKGLGLIRDLLNGTVLNSEAMYYQDAILLNFINKDLLVAEDFKIIKKLKLDNKWKNLFPLIESYVPPYIPRKLNENEVEFMTNVIEQALIVCKNYKGKENELIKYNKKVLIRIPNIVDDTIEWKEEYIDFNIKEMNYFEKIDGYINEIQIKKLSKKKYPHVGEIEFEAFRYFEPVKDEKYEYPRYPIIGVFILCETDEVLNAVIVNEDMNYCASVFRDNLTDIIKKTKTIPKKIFVQNQISGQIIKPLADKLDIEVIMVEELYSMNNFKEEMSNRFYN